MASGIKLLTDEMFAAAARALATLVEAAAWQRGLTDRPRPPDIRADAARRVYQPIYPSYAAGAA